MSDFAALSYKELAERLAHYLSSALVSAQYSMTDETMHDALGLCDQVTRRKAAPTEDVRAVVDEPVANCFERRNGAGEWVNDSKTWANGLPDAEILNECKKYPHLYRIRLAYAAPPCPMVLPERICGKDAWRSGWNACLDRIAELNK